MKNVEYLFGNENIINMPLPIFTEQTTSFIMELSAEILKSPLARQYPDLSALAFWGRKANIQNMKEMYEEMPCRLGRGLCFHIAPSNIPINFAFSYLFSLLAGNANIVRLPSKSFPQIDAFCSILKKVIVKYPEVEKRTAFIRYSRNNEITSEFCKMADVRMIWGGDETIAMIKSMQTSPRCVDVAFADRYSLAVIDGNAILSADDVQMKRLADNFYNDTYLMDQNACSSPQIILWQNDSREAREKFWNKVIAVVQQKYVLQDAVAVDKYTKFCEESISNLNIKEITYVDNLLYRAELKELNHDIINHRGNGGFFFEYALKNISELAIVITEKYQTITYFGIEAKALQENLIEACVRGIDRIVPIGQAMNIDVIWDGHDLIRELSRVVKVN